MESHGPCTLKGPVTLHREWWQKPRKRRSPLTAEPAAVVSGIRFALVATHAPRDRGRHVRDARQIGRWPSTAWRRDSISTSNMAPQVP